MKKALLIAALAISMNASAQDLPSTSGMQDQVPYVGEIFRTRTEDAGKKTTGIYPHEIFGRTILRPTYEHLNSFQQNDSIYTWRWDTTLIGWVLESKIINMLYDANNNLTFFTSQYWDSTAFVNDFQITRTYDANNNQTSSLYQDWDGSDWVNNNLYTTTYDANNNQTSDLYQVWNGSDWLNAFHSTHTYDANNFLQYETIQYFDSTGTIIPGCDNAPFPCSPSDSTHYYYHTISDVNDVKAEDGNFNVYPNPSSGKFTVSSKSTIDAIEIYNLLGERVYSDSKFTQQTSNEIDLSNQGKGIYIINIYAGKNRHTRKIVVQ